jgi:hypothetical protein
MNPIMQKTILALDLHPRSYGYAVLEGPNELLDWGKRSFWQGVHAVKVPMHEKLAVLLDEQEPDLILIRKPKTAISRRRVRAVMTLAKRRRIPVRLISGEAIRNSFPRSNKNKYQIAIAVAERFPELLPRLGARRKMWQSEKYSMSIFDATALGLSLFSLKTTPDMSRNETLSALPH